MTNRNIERTAARIQRVKRNQHNRLVLDYAQRLEESDLYDRILIQHEYGEEWEKIKGEMDLCGMKGNRRIIFEMKGSHSYTNKRKAVKQLKRARDYFKGYRVTMFYVAPNRLERILW